MVEGEDSLDLFRIVGVLFVAQASPREDNPNPPLVVVETVLGVLLVTLVLDSHFSLIVFCVLD